VALTRSTEHGHGAMAVEKIVPYVQFGCELFGSRGPNVSDSFCQPRGRVLEVTRWGDVGNVRRCLFGPFYCWLVVCSHWVGWGAKTPASKTREN